MTRLGLELLQRRSPTFDRQLLHHGDLVRLEVDVLPSRPNSSTRRTPAISAKWNTVHSRCSEMPSRNCLHSASVQPSFLAIGGDYERPQPPVDRLRSQVAETDVPS